MDIETWSYIGILSFCIEEGRKTTMILISSSVSPSALQEGSFLVTSVYSLCQDNDNRKKISHG